MNTTQCKIPFGGSDITLTLPPDWQVIDTLVPNEMPELTDLPASLDAALVAPIGCAPLTLDDVAGKNIVLAVDDISRPTPIHKYFGHILQYLESLGADRDKLLVLPGLGTHRAMTTAEMERKLGKKNLQGLSWENHEYENPNVHERLGETPQGTEVLLNHHLKKADLILCIGAIEPHALLGFGGGLKMIVPGLAHEKTIGQNHMQGTSPVKYNYIGAKVSPMRKDIEDAAALLGKRIFIINAVMNQELDICRFVCGDPVEAQREGAETARTISGREIGEKADVIILGSHPLNADLRQGMKCIANLETSLKPGGLFLAMLECRGGIGDVPIPTWAPPHWLFRGFLKVIGRKHIQRFVDLIKDESEVEERFLSHFSLQVIREKEIYVYSKKLPSDAGARLGLFKQFNHIVEMMRAAARFAPEKARVYIYPYGGVTFPIMKSE